VYTVQSEIQRIWSITGTLAACCWPTSARGGGLQWHVPTELRVFCCKLTLTTVLTESE